MKLRECTKEEFDRFIAEYPQPLQSDVAMMFEPPVQTLNDFTGGKVWPESVVAAVTLFESYPKETDSIYKWAPNQYQVLA